MRTHRFCRAALLSTSLASFACLPAFGQDHVPAEAPRPSDPSLPVAEAPHAAPLAPPPLSGTGGVRAESATSSSDVPPIRQVVLSSAGIAEYVRHIPAQRFADGREELSIPTRVEDVDDALKSMLVLGEGVRSVELRLPSSEVIADVFTGLPFGPDDLDSIEDIVARLPGTMVEVVREAREGEAALHLRGRVMGIARPEVCGDDAVCPSVLLIRDEEGALVRVTVEDGVRIVPLDPDVLGLIDKGLDALSGRSMDRSRTIRAEVSAVEGADDVEISTVLAAPVWKTAYRAVIDEAGDAAFQAWAIVENATQEDWDGVALVLTSGHPRTLKADLYARRYGAREVFTPAAPPVAAQAMFARAAGAAAPMMERALDVTADHASMAKLETGVEAQDAVVGARFPLPQPVSLRAGEVLALPLLSGDLSARKVGRIQALNLPQGGDLAPVPWVLDVKNDTGTQLPGGVVTIHHAGEGFSGDADVPTMEPGARHNVAFAHDSGARAGVHAQHERRIRALVPGNGVIRVEEDAITLHRFHVEAPQDEAMRIVLDMPVEQVGSSTGQERSEVITVDGFERVERFAKDMGAGEVWDFEVTRTVPERTEWIVGDVGDAQLLAWASQAEDPATKEWLGRAVALREEVARLDAALAKEVEKRARLSEDLARWKGMLETLQPGTEPYDRFLRDVLQGEEAWTSLEATRASLERELEAARAAFAQHIGAP